MPSIPQHIYKHEYNYCGVTIVTGWDQGCLTMKQGEIARLTIPGELGYGAGGFPAWGYPLVNHTMCTYVYLCARMCMCAFVHP